MLDRHVIRSQFRFRIMSANKSWRNNISSSTIPLAEEAGPAEASRQAGGDGLTCRWQPGIESHKATMEAMHHCQWKEHCHKAWKVPLCRSCTKEPYSASRNVALANILKSKTKKVLLRNSCYKKWTFVSEQPNPALHCTALHWLDWETRMGTDTNIV